MENKIFKNNELHSNESVFCEVMKNHTFNSSAGPKLEEKLKPGEGSQKFGRIQKNLYCLLGNGNDKVLTIPEIANELLIRNYPEVVGFDGEGKLVIFVPEWYLTKASTCVEPSRSETLQGFVMIVVEFYSVTSKIQQIFTKKNPLRK